MYEIMVLLEGRDAQNQNPFNCSLAPSMAIPQALMFQEEGLHFPGKKLTFPLSLSLSQSRDSRRKYSQQRETSTAGSGVQVIGGKDNCRRNLMIQHFISGINICDGVEAGRGADRGLSLPTHRMGRKGLG